MTAQNTLISADRGWLKRGSIVVPLLLALVFVGLPVLLAPFDFWDGRILDHALDTGQNAAVEDWFMSSGWAVQYWIFTGVQNLAQTTGLSGATMLDLIALISLGGVIVETVRFGLGVAGLSRNWAAMMGCTVAVFPAWTTLLSSVLFIYVFCTWLILLATRLIFQPNQWKLLLGFLILIFSFQLNSNFAFAVALGAAYTALSSLQQGNLDRSALIRFFAITIIAVGAYATLNLVFTPTGLYASYNQILAGGLTMQLTVLTKGAVNYATYPIVILVALTASHIALRMLRLVGVIGRDGDDRHDETGTIRALIWPVLLAVLLIGAAAFPYVVVGKSSNLNYVYEWNQRHTVLLALPAAFFLVACTRLMACWRGRADSLRALVPAILAIAVLAFFQLSATNSKLARGIYEAGIIAALRTMAAPEPGVVLIKAPEIAEPLVRFYESNWLLAQAYGREDWLSVIGPTANSQVEIRDWMTAPDAISEIYRMKHIMRSFRDTCVTSMEVKGAPYGLVAALGWLASGNVANRLQVTTLRSDCN